jgi:hypothetical protein
MRDAECDLPSLVMYRLADRKRIPSAAGLIAAVRLASSTVPSGIGTRRSTSQSRSDCVAGGSFITHPISLVGNDIRALLPSPVSGRIATKARWPLRRWQ